MARFDITQPWTKGQGGAAPEPTGGELQMMTPTRPAGFVSDWLVPLMQSLTTGAFASGLIVFILSELGPDWEINGFKVWLFLALAISSVVWVFLLADTRRLLRQIETLTGLDLNRDGEIGGKASERLVIVNAGQEKDQAAKAEASERQSTFALFVARLPVKGTAARTWESELGRPTYQEYRDALIRLGWARWNSTKADGTPNEKRGWELVKPAPEILERISG